MIQIDSSKEQGTRTCCSFEVTDSESYVMRVEIKTPTFVNLCKFLLCAICGSWENIVNRDFCGKSNRFEIAPIDSQSFNRDCAISPKSISKLPDMRKLGIEFNTNIMFLKQINVIMLL